MRPRFLFITGTDTGVGKTVLTSWLTRHLLQRGMAVAAFKPVSSGGRADAKALRAALQGGLTLDEINPWHFRAPIAPLLAARREQQQVKMAEVLAHIRTVGRRFDVVLVEGAGGLLSPLGEDFDSRDLVGALRADPIVVCPNRLGVVNHALLTIGSLSGRAARRAQVVLMSPSRPNLAGRTNPRLLSEILGRDRVHKFPQRVAFAVPQRAHPTPAARHILDALTQGVSQ
jgi:dethiobiotin synthetase